jgi:hypothetical protein
MSTQAFPRYGDAMASIEAQGRMLAACRTVGVQAVLPVGGQIQRGRRWNDEHPEDARCTAGGQPLDIYGGATSASFYVPACRADNEAY